MGVDGDKVPTCYDESRKEVITMRPKEVQQKLGIDADRIKLFKRENVFVPENPPSGNRGTNYTETDLENLRFLVVLTKSGLTCSDIRKMQEGECSLEEAIISRIQYIQDDIAKKLNSSHSIHIVIGISSLSERQKVKSSLIWRICMNIIQYRLSERFSARIAVMYWK